MLTAPLARSLATTLATSLAGRGGSLLPPLPTMPALIVYGQSLAIGDTKGLLVGATGPSATHKMLGNAAGSSPRFNIYDGGAAKTADRFAALEEKIEGTYGQTALTSSLEGMARPWLGMSGGLGATTIANMSLGTNPYTRLTQNITNMTTVGALPAVFVFWQGQQDNIANTKAAYKTSLAALKSAVITASGNPDLIFAVIVISGSCNGTNTCAGTLAISEMIREGTIVGIAADYFLPYTKNDPHPWQEGQDWMGHYIQRYINAAAKGKSYDTMRMTGATRIGTTVTITTTMPATLDEVNYHPVTQSGFKVSDSTGGANIAVTNVFVSGSSIILTLASAPTEQAVIRYALDYAKISDWALTNPNTAGNIYSASIDRCSIIGKSYPMHHWLTPDQITSV